MLGLNLVLLRDRFELGVHRLTWVLRAPRPLRLPWGPLQRDLRYQLYRVVDLHVSIVPVDDQGVLRIRLGPVHPHRLQFQRSKLLVRRAPNIEIVLVRVLLSQRLMKSKMIGSMYTRLYQICSTFPNDLLCCPSARVRILHRLQGPFPPFHPLRLPTLRSPTLGPRHLVHLAPSLIPSNR